MAPLGSNREASRASVVEPQLMLAAFGLVAAMRTSWIDECCKASGLMISFCREVHRRGDTASRDKATGQSVAW